MTAADTVIADNHGAVAANVNVGGDFHQTVTYNLVKDFLRKRLLDTARVAELLRTYEPPPRREQAAAVLDRHHAAVLIGGEGTGRRTTAVELLDERKVTLQELAIDQDQDLGKLPCEPACGYLFGTDIPDPGGFEDYARRLRDKGSYLVVWTTQDVKQHSGTFLADVGVELGMPAPEGLFRRILDTRFPPNEAAWWRGRQDFEPILKEARPAAVVRLVDLIDRTMATQGCDDAAVRAVIDAYRNWDAYLQTRFTRSELDLRSRVLLIAVAMLEDAPESAVYQAATALREQLGVPPEEGHGLAGEGTRCLHNDAEVHCADDGTVRFAKPAFAESVLDYVARTYPDVWQHVRSWAVELPGLRSTLGTSPSPPGWLVR